MNCSKCKDKIKAIKTDYGHSYECPCGHVCIQLTGNLVPMELSGSKPVQDKAGSKK
jgi:hypothetical protein